MKGAARRGQREGILLVCLLLSSAALEAQQYRSIRGTVRDTAGGPLEGVELLFGKRKVSTNSRGAYQVDSLRLGNVFLTVRFAGYVPIRAMVEIEATRPNDLSFVLTRAPFQLPPIVTEMRRTVTGEVVASNNDQDSASHVRTGSLMIERAKRLAEQGKQVFVLMDSLTRLARAFNKNIGNSGRTMSGGIDIRALEVPKRLFGSARVFEEGGSVTVIGTALIETGSRMDDVIFEEFKGTGNMELVLSRDIANRRIFPAIDINKSGTRREELLLDQEERNRVYLLRTFLADMPAEDAMAFLIKQMQRSKTNREFFQQMAS